MASNGKNSWLFKDDFFSKFSFVLHSQTGSHSINIIRDAVLTNSNLSILIFLPVKIILKVSTSQIWRVRYHLILQKQPLFIIHANYHFKQKKNESFWYKYRWVVNHYQKQINRLIANPRESRFDLLETGFDVFPRSKSSLPPEFWWFEE